MPRRDAPRGHLQQIPEPSQLALLHAEEQWLSFKILSGYQVPHPIMKSEPSYRLKETHIGLLYLQYSYGHDPEFMDFDRDLQLSLDRFTAECEAAGMRISTSKSESMVLNRKRVECTLRVGDEILPQVEEFKYLGVLFTIMRTLHGSVVVKRELSRKAKLSIYQSIYVPALTYGHELWVMTERTRSRVQAAEMSFLRRVAGLSLRDRVRSSVIREELGVDPLLLRIERSQMRWLGHLVRMPPGRLPGEVFRARPTGRRPRGRPRTRWRDYVSRLAWERLGIPQEELAEVAGEREVWASLLRLLPPRPDPG
ncbi:putative uncharacterized transposon-derived protein F52C9.6 [Merluccius polli]|uniref:Uncharacterized transposon-derived protein F52C9.6 n=1 Tax=Merluccius polli TaxID=89951 RepID=A0AA47PAH1_MERPO|nr:putative uncharacterized transposon-derived protein F52C9.6 [Merluccius polli]